MVKRVQKHDIPITELRTGIDYLYVEEYAKVFAIGIAKAKSLDTMRLFSRQVNFLTEGMDVGRSKPLARLAAMALDRVQPVPWVLGLSICVP